MSDRGVAASSWILLGSSARPVEGAPTSDAQPPTEAEGSAVDGEALASVASDDEWVELETFEGDANEETPQPQDTQDAASSHHTAQANPTSAHNASAHSVPAPSGQGSNFRSLTSDTEEEEVSLDGEGSSRAAGPAAAAAAVATSATQRSAVEERAALQNDGWDIIMESGTPDQSVAVDDSVAMALLGVSSAPRRERAVLTRRCECLGGPYGFHRAGCGVCTCLGATNGLHRPGCHNAPVREQDSATPSH